MKGLYKVLPPFAPDYSGVCSVLFELGGLAVVHDAGGCTGNVTGYDEPRWYGNSSATFSSELREIEAVVGDDERLLGRIEEAAKDLKRSFIAILGSPAPMVIGTDYRALANAVSQKTGLPALSFDTNGIRYYDEGASMAFLELARQFVKPPSAVREQVVNIIGATPLDLGNERHIQKVISLLLEAGCKKVSCWGMGSTLEDIEEAGRARLNIVVSRSGLEAARYMQREYEMPYLVGIPVGQVPTHRFSNNVRLLLDSVCDLNRTPNAAYPETNGLKALVIGEQVMGNSIRDCLRMELGVSRVTAATFFGQDDSLTEKGDIFLEHEDDLTLLVKKHHYDFIVGDPLYKELLPASRSSFIKIPHAAVSSRLYWDNELDYIGYEGTEFFNLAIKHKDERKIL